VCPLCETQPTRSHPRTGQYRQYRPPTVGLGHRDHTTHAPRNYSICVIDLNRNTFVGLMPGNVRAPAMKCQMPCRRSRQGVRPGKRACGSHDPVLVRVRELARVGVDVAVAVEAVVGAVVLPDERVRPELEGRRTLLVSGAGGPPEDADRRHGLSGRVPRGNARSITPNLGRPPAHPHQPTPTESEGQDMGDHGTGPAFALERKHAGGAAPTRGILGRIDRGRGCGETQGAADSFHPGRPGQDEPRGHT
jgi:hypothetical protein